jgi:hypothetical protein
VVWPRKKNARGDTTKINYGVVTGRDKRKRTSKKNVDEKYRAAINTRHLEADQWLNRKEWCLDSGRWRQLSQDRKNRYIVL